MFGLFTVQFSWLIFKRTDLLGLRPCRRSSYGNIELNCVYLDIERDRNGNRGIEYERYKNWDRDKDRGRSRGKDRNVDKDYHLDRNRGKDWSNGKDGGREEVVTGQGQGCGRSKDRYWVYTQGVGRNKDRGKWQGQWQTEIGRICWQ